MMMFRMLASLLGLGWLAACDLLVLPAPFDWPGTVLLVLIALALGAPVVLKLFWPGLAPDAAATQSRLPEIEGGESAGSVILNRLVWGFGVLVTGILGWALEFITSNFFGFLVVLAIALMLRDVLPEKMQRVLGLREAPDDENRDRAPPMGEEQTRRERLCKAMFVLGFLAIMTHFLVLLFLSDFGWHWGAVIWSILMLIMLGLLLGAFVDFPVPEADQPATPSYPVFRGIALALAIFGLNMALENLFLSPSRVWASMDTAYAFALVLLPAITAMLMPELKRWPWPWLTRSS